MEFPLQNNVIHQFNIWNNRTSRRLQDYSSQQNDHQKLWFTGKLDTPPQNTYTQGGELKLFSGTAILWQLRFRWRLRQFDDSARYSPAAPLGNRIVLEFWLETFCSRQSCNGIIPSRIAGNEMTRRWSSLRDHVYLPDRRGFGK